MITCKIYPPAHLQLLLFITQQMQKNSAIVGDYLLALLIQTFDLLEFLDLIDEVLKKAFLAKHMRTVKSKENVLFQHADPTRLSNLLSGFSYLISAI